MPAHTDTQIAFTVHIPFLAAMMRGARRVSYGVLMGAALSATASAQSKPCAVTQHGNHSYTICTFDAATDRIEIYHTHDDGTPIRTFDRLSTELARKNTKLVFAMNAGMYHSDRRPVGLLVEKGAARAALNTSFGFGNFYLKPNGVFFISQGKAGVLETSAYKARGLSPEFATQSGPMLLIDGALHPRFLRNASSRNIRNGVGVSDDGRTVSFAISNSAVTFFEFATFFRDVAGVRNALYLDGSISRLYAPQLDRNDSGEDMGPIVAVTAPAPAPAREHHQKD